VFAFSLNQRREGLCQQKAPNPKLINLVSSVQTVTLVVELLLFAHFCEPSPQSPICKLSTLLGGFPLPIFTVWYFHYSPPSISIAFHLTDDLVNDIAEVMSVTQSFDSYNSPNSQSAGGATNPEYDLKDAQLDEASASNDGQGFGPSGIFSGGIGNLTQTATQAVSAALLLRCFFASNLNGILSCHSDGGSGTLVQT